MNEQSADEDKAFAEIRANIVFEKMLASVLIATGATLIAHFVVNLGVRAVGAGLSLAGLGATIYGAVAFSAVFFLGGFASSLAVGIPLFSLLEKAKMRRAAPYALASLAIGLVALMLFDRAPSFEAPWRALYLLPGLFAALVFARKMRAIWRIADRAPETKAGGEIFRIH